MMCSRYERSEGRRSCPCGADELCEQTRWAMLQNGARMSLVVGAERERGHAPGELRGSEEAVLCWEQRRGPEVMLLAARVVSGLRWECNDRVVSRLHKIHEVTGRRQSARQVLIASSAETAAPSPALCRPCTRCRGGRRACRGPGAQRPSRGQSAGRGGD